MQRITDIEPHQTNHLMLLVGANTLPNYVAARLLLKPGGKLYLIHTAEVEPRAKNLHKVLAPEHSAASVNQSVAMVLVDAGNPNNIYERVAKTCRLPGAATLHLDYTGGTKTMAVHAVRAAEKTLGSRASYSYLDASHSQLVLHDQDLAGIRVIRVGEMARTNVTLEQLLTLHLASREAHVVNGNGRDIARLKLVLNALATLHQTLAGCELWHWIGGSDRNDGNTSENVVPHQGRSAGWTRWPDLRTVRRYPPAALARLTELELMRVELVADAFEHLFGEAATNIDVGVAQLLGFGGPRYKGLRSCGKWLRSEWFEDLVYQHFSAAVSGNVHIDEIAQGVKLRLPSSTRIIDIDMLALRHFQLYAVSCMASPVVQDVKDHLFEALVRARQIGGDDARVALVCLVKDSQAMQNELASILGAGSHIRVFGVDEIATLRSHFENWFAEEDKQSL